MLHDRTYRFCAEIWSALIFDWGKVDMLVILGRTNNKVAAFIRSTGNDLLRKRHIRID